MFTVNVPNVAGVPAVNFSANVSVNIPFLTSDAATIFRGVGRSQPWGIYLGGVPVVLADNVVSMDYRQSWVVSDFPVEKGAFASYNKVQTPFDARFRFTAGGSESNREGLLSSIAAIAGTIQLFTIVTPEAIYPNANITSYNYSRTSQNGLGLMIVDVITQEIRQVSGPSYTSVASAPSAPYNNNGTTQSVDATTAQTSAVIEGHERRELGLK